MQAAWKDGRGDESTRGYERIQDAIGAATDDVDWCAALHRHDDSGPELLTLWMGRALDGPSPAAAALAHAELIRC